MVSIKQIVWEPIKYLLIFLNYRHVSKAAAHFQNSYKMFISFIQVSKRKKEKKYLKNMPQSRI